MATLTLIHVRDEEENKKKFGTTKTTVKIKFQVFLRNSYREKEKNIFILFISLSFCLFVQNKVTEKLEIFLFLSVFYQLP